VNAENLVTFSSWRGYDAEGIGNTSRNFPSPKIFTFGLEVAF
jgi:hypothetical protein